MEYDIDEVIYDNRSAFQHIQILHSNTFGNMLVLDDLQSKKRIIGSFTKLTLSFGCFVYKMMKYKNYNFTPDLADSDLIYTESIMCRGKEDYKDKEILILGGGDGALLHELRKEQPKHVTMIEVKANILSAL